MRLKLSSTLTMGVALHVFRNCYHSQIVRFFLRDVGFVVNCSKSIWVPVKSLIWLGIHWNLAMERFRISPKRPHRFLALPDQLLRLALYVTARDFALIAGHISSISPVIGNITPIKTRQVYKIIDSESS